MVTLAQKTLDLNWPCEQVIFSQKSEWIWEMNSEPKNKECLKFFRGFASLPRLRHCPPLQDSKKRSRVVVALLGRKLKCSNLSGRKGKQEEK